MKGRDVVSLASNARLDCQEELLLALAERWLDLADAQDTRAKAGHGFRKIAADGLPRVSQKHQNGE